jgi:DNA-binding transcriptional LysR family regulator
MMLPHLQASLAAAEAAKKQAMSFRKRESGQLAIGACSTIAAELGTPLLVGLSAEMPGLDLYVEIGNVGQLEGRLISGDLDTALLAPLGEASAGSAQERFDYHTFIKDAFVVAFAPGHRFEKADEVTLEDLDGEPLIVRTGCGHEDAIAAAMDARGISRLVRHTSGDERWLGEIVRSGLGCMLWPESVARSRGLLFRRLTDLPLVHNVCLTTVAGRRHSPALAALVRLTTRFASAGGAAVQVA